MADQRTFVLIGDFQDNITPALESINNSIAGLKRTMSTMTSKRGGGFNDVTQSVGRLVSSQKHLANSIKEVGDAAKVATGELKAYKNMVGKVASAHYHIAKAANQAGDKIASANNKAITSIDRLDRREKLYEGARRRRMRSLSSLGAASYSPTRRTTTRPAATPRMAGGGGRGVGYGGSFDMPAFAFGMTLGQGISQPITAAVLSGFQLGVGLLQQSFQYIAGSFAERVQDQMTDLQAAGGYYSIAQRQKNPMFTSLQQSVMFTQRTNDVLERLASDLPGSTEDYVKVSKRIGDSVMRLVDSNEKGAIDYAKELMAKGGLQESYRGVSLEGPNAREGAVQLILGELTKKTVLAGFGGTTGRGGAAGAYGLPALMERLITNPDTSMAQLQKYASVFGDPKIMSALQRAMPELEKAGPDMLARTKVINSMLDEIASPQMIAAMRKSMAGIMEAYRSAFFSPGTGLFGFGRKLKDASGKLQPLTDVYGRFIRTVEENGKKVEQVVQTAAEADQVDMDVFNMFSDIISNYAAILKPIVDNLYLIWDPLQGIADALRQARIISIEVLQTFRNYVAGLEKFAEGITDKGLKEAFLSTKSFRATLLTITNLFTQLGIFSEADFFKLQKKIIDPKTSMEGLGEVLKSLTDTFFSSDAATEVGKFFGRIMREVVIVLSQITDFGVMLGKSNLASGLAEGFGKEGFESLEKMFKNIYEMIFGAVGKAISSIPPSIIAKIAGYALMGSLVLAGIAGIGMAIGAVVAGLFSQVAAQITGGGMLSKCFQNVANIACGAGGGSTGANGAKPRPGKKTGRKGYSGGGGFTPTPQKPNVRTGSISNVMMRPVGPMPPQGFSRIALPGKAPEVVSGVTSPGRAPSIPKPIKPVKSGGKSPFNFLTRVKAKGAGTLAAAMITMETAAPGLAKGMKNFTKSIPKGMGVLAAADFGLRLLGGESVGRAAGGAGSSFAGAVAGGKAGAALGTVFAPGAGTAIGGVIGSIAGGIMGDTLFDFFVPETVRQQQAAKTQKEAADIQLAAARDRGIKETGIDLGAAQAFVRDPMALYQAQMLTGQKDNPAVKALVEASTNLKAIQPKIDKQKDEVNKQIQRYMKPASQGGLNYSREQANRQPEVRAAIEELNRLQGKEKSLTKSIYDGFNKLPTEISKGLVSTIQKVPKQALEAAWVEWVKGIQKPVVNFEFTNIAPKGQPNPGMGGKVSEIYNWEAFGSPGRKAGSLAAAIHSENKHKPPGSKIVIANSSERIIPTAANGYIPSHSLYSRGYSGWDSSGEITVNAPITINGAGQDAEQIAARVAYMLGDAIATARSRSLFT